MNYDHKHQMAFLLSLAALPLVGCVITDGDDDDDGGDDTTSNNTMTADDDGSTGGSVSMSGTLDTSGATLDDSETSAATVDGTGTTGAEIPQVCTDIGAHFEKCMFKDAELRVDECVMYLVDAGYTGECLTANEEYYACLAAAPCEDFAKENPCQAQLDSAMEICAGGTESGSDSGGSESSTSTG